MFLILANFHSGGQLQLAQILLSWFEKLIGSQASQLKRESVRLIQAKSRGSVGSWAKSGNVYGRRKSLLGHVSSKTIWQRFTFVHIILHVQRKKKLLSPWPWFVFIVQCVHVWLRTYINVDHWAVQGSIHKQSQVKSKGSITANLGLVLGPPLLLTSAMGPWKYGIRANTAGWESMCTQTLRQWLTQCSRRLNIVHEIIW